MNLSCKTEFAQHAKIQKHWIVFARISGELMAFPESAKNAEKNIKVIIEKQKNVSQLKKNITLVKRVSW